MLHTNQTSLSLLQSVFLSWDLSVKKEELFTLQSLVRNEKLSGLSAA